MIIFFQTFLPVILSASEESSRASAEDASTNWILRFAQNDMQEPAAKATDRTTLLHDRGCYADAWVHGDDLRACADASWLAAVLTKAATLIQAEPGNRQDSHA